MLSSSTFDPLCSTSGSPNSLFCASVLSSAYLASSALNVFDYSPGTSILRGVDEVQAVLDEQVIKT